MPASSIQHRAATDSRPLPASGTRPPLYKYQQRGVRRLLRENVTLLAWAMGTGKSRVVCEAVDQAGSRVNVVVCPAIGRTVWPYQLRTWGRPSWRVVIVEKPGDLPDRARLDPGVTYWFIVASSALSIHSDPKEWGHHAFRLKPDLLVVDEAHQFAHATSARSKALYGAHFDRIDCLALATIPWVVAMSGTFVSNYTSELWPTLHALAPHTIMHPNQHRPLSLVEFIDRYSVLKTGPHGTVVNDSKNTADLRARTRSSFDTLNLEQAHPDMPPLTFGEAPVPLPEWSSMAEFSKRIGLELPEGMSDEEILAYIERKSAQLSTARRVLGTYKILGVIEWLTDRLASTRDDKLICFAHHRAVIDQITEAMEKLTGVAVVSGDTPDNQRAAAVERFQHHPNVRLFLGQTHAAGTSLTLTAASDVVFAEGDWSPAVIAQAAARAHRIGQTRPVTATLLFLDGTLDEHIARAASRKAAQIALLFDRTGLPGADDPCDDDDFNE